MFKEIRKPVQQSLAEQFRSVMTGLGDLNAAHISGVDGIDPASLGYDPSGLAYSIYLEKYMVYARLEHIQKGWGKKHILSVEHPILHFSSPIDELIVHGVAEYVEPVSTPFSVGYAPYGDITIGASMVLDPSIPLQSFETITSTYLLLLSHAIAPSHVAVKEWAEHVQGQ